MLIKRCPLCERDLPIGQFNSKRKECKACSRDVKLLQRYGITREQYDQMLENQDGHCALCPATPAEVGMLCVDHDHRCCPREKTCGKCLRALLCPSDNVSLGRMNDDADRFRRAADYIEFHTERIEIN